MSGLYTFAVVDADAPAVAAPLRLVRVGRIAAVVEAVDVTEYEGKRLEENLNDRGWLERAVRHHESVIEGLMPATTVVPMRFGSIFSTEDGLRAMLGEHVEPFLDLLDRLRGRQEWGVRVRVDRDALVRRLAPSAKAASNGGDYLRRRRDELQANDQVGGVAAQLARDVHEQLSRETERSVLLQLRQPDPQTLVSAAYLVPVADQVRFFSRIARLQSAHEGLTLEVTGPWPAYSFTSADVGGPRG